MVIYEPLGLPSLTAIISLMVLGCANNPPIYASQDARLWQEEKERQRQGIHEEGHIGYIGNEGSGRRVIHKSGCLPVPEKAPWRASWRKGWRLRSRCNGGFMLLWR